MSADIYKGGKHVFGVYINRPSIELLLKVLAFWADQKVEHKGKTVCLVNAYSLVEANRNAAHMRALSTADICLADGIGVALFARTTKIAGADLMLAAARHPELGEMRHVLLGGFGVAYRAALRQWTEAGMLPHCKPWIPETATDGDLVELANGIDHDILWLSLGCPRQERWMYENRSRLRSKVVIAVGAAFDMLAGRIPRAPRWMRSIGLEWAWRIWQEPRRWRRQVDAAVGFLRLLCR